MTLSYHIRPFERTERLFNWNRGALITKHFSELPEYFKFWKSVHKQQSYCNFYVFR